MLNTIRSNCVNESIDFFTCSSYLNDDIFRADINNSGAKWFDDCV
ncbi:acetolactate synthase 3 regulatory subunit [Listeria monocytogenes]|nr:acetolactate synthase 3 regulatory subunit [Listeria monocytogenes]